jgi:glycosyltransferase involved in cell wall biosynthesis
VRLLAFDLPGATLPETVDEVDVAVRPPYRAHERFGKIREIAAIARAVLRADARVVVTRAAGPHVGLAGVFAKLSRRRFVHSSANVSDFDFERLEKKRRNRMLFRLGMRLADEIVVQTDEQVRLCEEQFGRTPRRIESIAEPAEQRQRIPEAFLWASRLVWYKRPFAYIDLARAVPNARFWMIPVPVAHSADSRELMDEVLRRAADVPNLEILETRLRPGLMELVERAVAMVNTADFEGMPNLFLESWGRGVPALALSHDPDGVIQRHGLGAFANGSASLFAELATRFWESRTGQTELAARCRAYVDAHHSPRAVASAWLDALRITGSADAIEFRDGEAGKAS